MTHVSRNYADQIAKDRSKIVDEIIRRDGPTPPTTTLTARLRELMEEATPGPWYAHDHNGMAELGEDPEKWIGYAWVGKPSCDPSMADQRRWDGGVAQLDRRRDGHEDYRNKAAHDAALIAYLVTNARTIIRLLEAGDGIEKIGAKILAKLDSETASVTQWDADELREALATLRAAREGAR